MTTTESYTDWTAKVRQILPECAIERLEDGELVIYTNVHASTDGDTVSPFTLPDDEWRCTDCGKVGPANADGTWSPIVERAEVRGSWVTVHYCIECDPPA